MILEVAVLDILENENESFEIAFSKAEKIISSMKGYIEHELQHCLEKQNRYILLVKWERLEDHTEGFRKSAEYQNWKQLLHHFYDPFPTVAHYKKINF